MEILKQKIAKLPPQHRWTIHLFESIMTQRPPDQGDDYTPEKLEAAYRKDMQKCFDLGLSKKDLRLLINAERLPPDRWDRDIVAKILKEE